MEILPSNKRQELLNYIHYVKLSIKEWQMADIRLADDSARDFTIMQAAEVIHTVFKDKEGKIYICNERDILMLIRYGAEDKKEQLANEITEEFSEGACEVHVEAATAEGFAKFNMQLKFHNKADTPGLSDIRVTRKENVVIVADDDMYMRMLVKKGLSENITVHEISDGNEVLAAYKKYIPDIIFLDIHMPGMDGITILNKLFAMDKEAYVVMLSADSSQENVEFTTKSGAKGFLAKPFTKEKLQEHINKCPTIR